MRSAFVRMDFAKMVVFVGPFLTASRFVIARGHNILETSVRKQSAHLITAMGVEHVLWRMGGPFVNAVCNIGDHSAHLTSVPQVSVIMEAAAIQGRIADPAADALKDTTETNAKDRKSVHRAIATTVVNVPCREDCQYAIAAIPTTKACDVTWQKYVQLATVTMADFVRLSMADMFATVLTPASEGFFVMSRWPVLPTSVITEAFAPFCLEADIAVTVQELDAQDQIVTEVSITV